MDYKCDWYAPTVAEPDPDILSKLTTQIAAGGLQGVGLAPLIQNCLCASVLF